VSAITPTSSTYGRLPDIGDYDLQEADWPSLNRVRWAPDVQRSALLVHDMQLFYTDALSPLMRDQLMRNVGALLAGARSFGIPVIYSAARPCRTRAERGLLVDFHGMGMKDIPEHYAIAPEVQPAPGDHMTYKKIYSAFFETDLTTTLEALGRDELLICGLYADIGCQLTAFDGFKRGIKPFIAADAMVGYTETQHFDAIAHMSRLCAGIGTVHSLLAELASSASTTSKDDM
jgi:bifunctional isochorismate lyase/aryl carrier protein